MSGVSKAGFVEGVETLDGEERVVQRFMSMGQAAGPSATGGDEQPS